MRGFALLSTVLLLGLAACGPIPVEDAEHACLDSALAAKHPRGTVGLGMSSDGRVKATGEITISSDYLTGRDPADVFNACVKSRSGQFPTRPLYDQPGWR